MAPGINEYLIQQFFARNTQTTIPKKHNTIQARDVYHHDQYFCSLINTGKYNATNEDEFRLIASGSMQTVSVSVSVLSLVLSFIDTVIQ